MSGVVRLQREAVAYVAFVVEVATTLYPRTAERIEGVQTLESPISLSSVFSGRWFCVLGSAYSPNSSRGPPRQHRQPSTPAATASVRQAAGRTQPRYDRPQDVHNANVLATQLSAGGGTKTTCGWPLITEKQWVTFGKAPYSPDAPIGQFKVR